MTVPATASPPPETTTSSGGGGGILGLFGTIVDLSSKSPITAVIDLIPDLPTPTEIITKVTDFVGDLFDRNLTKIPETEIPARTPPVFAGLWDLINPEPVGEFALAPLPESLARVAKKFPGFVSTFKSLGVVRLSDVEKLLGSSFVIPRVESLEELPTEVVIALQTAPPESFPVAKLQGEVPTQSSIKSPHLLSWATFLDISKDGTITQRVNAISGQWLSFAVRPEHKAKSVTGYLVLKESRFSDSDVLSLPLSSLVASVILSDGPQGKIVDKMPTIEEHLLLNKFSYQDGDDDGVYTAEVQAPMVASDFEVITVIDYEDPKLGNKELRFSLVVDPEGYVFSPVNGGELRIEKAKVTIFVKDPQGRFILWPAEDLQQRNPQTTGKSGEYSFLVPPGEYYMSVEADGYKTYQGDSFTVSEGSGVHENIELKPAGILGGLGWPWLLILLLLLVIILLLAYNFYKDKQRTH